MTAPTISMFSDIILAALNTSTVIDGKCVMLRAVYTDDTRRDMTVTVERYELTEGEDGALSVSSIEQMQLFPSPVAPVITVTPAQQDVAPVPDSPVVTAEPDPTVTWMPAVAVTDTAGVS
jgi:hypothetical protein